MIIDIIENGEIYCDNESFMKAFKFLKCLNADSEEKRYDLGNDMYAVIESYSTKPVSEGRLEAHKEYIDIQMVLSGEELIGWHNIKGLDFEIPYDPEKDIVFYKSPEKPVSFITMLPDIFMLLYPEDGHMPQINSNNRKINVKKVVVKIPVNP